MGAGDSTAAVSGARPQGAPSAGLVGGGGGGPPRGGGPADARRRGAARERQVVDHLRPATQLIAVSGELLRLAELFEAVAVAAPLEEGLADRPSTVDLVHLVELHEAAPEAGVGGTEGPDVEDELEGGGEAAA